MEAAFGNTIDIDFGLAEKAEAALLSGTGEEFTEEDRILDEATARYTGVWTGLFDAVRDGKLDAIYWQDASGNTRYVVRSLRIDGVECHCFDCEGRALSTVFAKDADEFIGKRAASDGVIVKTYAAKRPHPSDIGAAKRARHRTGRNHGTAVKIHRGV